MEMRSLSLCLKVPGWCGTEFVDSERGTTANTCVMPVTSATRNVRFVASRGGPFAASAKTPEKTGNVMLLVAS